MHLFLEYGKMYRGLSAQAAKDSKKIYFSVCGKKERQTGYELQRM